MATPEYDVTRADAGTAHVAAGDGAADDTAAIQERLSLASETPGGGSVYLPPGSYRVTRSLQIKGIQPLTIRGDGYMSHLLWDFREEMIVVDGIPMRRSGDLFVWDDHTTSSFIHDLKITAQHDQQATTTAFRALRGATDLRLQRVRIEANEPNRWGSGLRLSAAGADPPESAGGDIYLVDVEFWRFRGTAVELRDVTDVHVRGCRFASTGELADSSDDSEARAPIPGSIGVHLAGNTGGVWIHNCDINETDTCILVERLHRPKWNRELFLSGGACDASNHGLVVRDDTWVTITGAWLCSNVSENLLVERGHDPRIEIAGGKICNAGSTIRDKPQPLSHHGLVIEGGELTMSGVRVWNNAGVGMIVGPDAHLYTVSGCSFTKNRARGARFDGVVAAVVGNLFAANGIPDVASFMGIPLPTSILPRSFTVRLQVEVPGASILMSDNQMSG